jgi:hypothetical protein
MRPFDVVEHTLTDGSRVFGVKGYDMTGSHLLVIDCDSSESANRLADLLSESTFGIEVQLTFTDGWDRLHANTMRW